MDGIMTVFYFCKIDVLIFNRNDVDFVEVGFVVPGDDGVAMA